MWVPPQGVHFSLFEWNQMHISNDEYLKEVKLYWGSKIAQRQYGEESFNKLSKQSKIQLDKQRYHDKRDIVL